MDEPKHSDDCGGCLPTPSGAGVYVGRHDPTIAEALEVSGLSWEVDPEPVMGNPLFPHGQCPACGCGCNWAGDCQNVECPSYVPGAEDEED